MAITFPGGVTHCLDSANERDVPITVTAAAGGVGLIAISMVALALRFKGVLRQNRNYLGISLLVPSLFFGLSVGLLLEKQSLVNTAESLIQSMVQRDPNIDRSELATAMEQLQKKYPGIRQLTSTHSVPGESNPRDTESELDRP